MYKFLTMGPASKLQVGCLTHLDQENLHWRGFN